MKNPARRLSTKNKHERRWRNVQIIEASLLAADLFARGRDLYRSFSRDLERHVTLIPVGGETVVEINDTLAKWRFTTKPQYLPRDWTEQRAARHHIIETSKHEANGRRKGRVIYVIDLELREVVAAIAFHIPRARKEAVLVTAWAVRNTPETVPEFMVLVYLAKRYIHALARKCRHPSYVDFVADNRTMAADLMLLGFPELPPGNARLNEIRFRQFED